ncbi:HNH homing endonuclease [Bacillus phage Silence]|nr:HNH homing endonuclease [Bacillus phage Silence]
MKNSFEKKGDLFIVFVKSAKAEDPIEIIVDKPALEKMQTFKNTWYVVFTNPKNRKPMPYVYGTLKGKKFLLHRFLLDPVDGEYVDHINRNTLDNRIENLRKVNATENAKNRSAYGYSGVRNVIWNKVAKKWIVSLKVNGKYVEFGRFDLIRDAEITAEKARKENGYI